MTNLNSLIKDPDWVKSQESKDELFANEKAYFLPGRAIDKSVMCCATICRWETRGAAGKSKREETQLFESEKAESETIPLYHPMALCFACNRTFHLKCVDIALRSESGKVWSNESLPWCCPECRYNPSNMYAETYYKSNDWKNGLIARRKKFLNNLLMTKNPKLVEAKQDTLEYYQEDLETAEVLDSSTYQSAYSMRDTEKDLHDNIDKISEIVAERDELKNQVKEMNDLRRKLEDLECKLNESSLSQPSFRTPSSTFVESQSKTSVDFWTKVYFEAEKKKNQSKSFDNASATKNLSGAGLTQPDKSFDSSNKSSTANKCDETNIGEQSVARAVLLEQQRKTLDKISKFSGDERDWIRFKNDVDRYQEVGEYNDIAMKNALRKALDGVAFERVQDVIHMLSFSEIMGILEDTFGDPTSIVEKRSEDLLGLKLCKDLCKEDVISIVTKIQSYLSACNYAKIPIANSNQLAKHIFEQLSSEQRQRCRRYHREWKGENNNEMIDLETLFKFLELLRKDLDYRKAKSTQVNSTSFVTPVQSSSPQNSQKNDRFVIRDLSEAKYMGYSTKLLNGLEKKCLACGKNHYTVECKSYYAMNKENRFKFVQEKNLCRNCIITTNHRANDCNLKPSCGVTTNGTRCNGKHHVSLHKSGGFRPNSFNKRRNNTNNNNNRANEIRNSYNNDNPVSDNKVDTSAIKSAPPVNQASGSQSGFDRIRNTIRSSDGPVTATIMTPLNNNNLNAEQGNTVKVFKTKFYASSGKSIIDFSVGDSASETTLLSEDLRRALNIEGEKCQINVRWADSTLKTIEAMKVNLEISGVHKEAHKLLLRNCYAVSSDDFKLPPRSLNMKLLKRRFPYLKPVKCDSYFDKVPKLLIGSHHAAVMESCGQLFEGGTGKPVGLLAKLGWSVYGGSPDTILAQSVANVQVESIEHRKDTAMTNEELYESFSYFNSIENLNLEENKSRHTEDEQKALEIMEEEMKILPNGAIEVPLVWNRHNKQIPRLPNNLKMVRERQISHEKSKIMKVPENRVKYIEKFKEYVAEGYIRAASAEDLNGEWPNVNYLPMTLVINTNKVPVGYRIVFDAAATYQGTSLNRNLLKGPDLLINLTDPLIRVRTKKVGFVADIKAMFMRMKVNMRDQQCQRVLFRENPDEELKIFIVSSVLFGPSCSPFQSQLCKNLLASAFKDVYPQASETIERFMYMDDLLTSEASTEEALRVATQCISMFKRIDWQLVSFQSNDIDFLKRLPNGSVKQELIPLMEDSNQKCTAKVLGCVWDTKHDNFIFNFDKNLFIKIVKDCEHKPTKRDQCSTIARVFDVNGFLSPLMIRGKIYLQRSWQNGIDWDQPISEDEHKLWKEWLAEFEKASLIKIPRRLCVADDLWATGEVELHVFCDAGGEAYAAVAYIVTTFENKRTSRIVMAKAKVTPLRYKSKTKVTEIPRLELYAALCASRLAHVITNCLKNLNLKRYLWSDSEVVLRWLKNPNMQLKPYATSPIVEILSKTDKAEWFYVPSKLNVADNATKIKKFDLSDSESVWFKGPEFLIQDKSSWPVTPLLLPKGEEKLTEELSLNNINAKDVELIEFKSPIAIPHLYDPIAKESCINNLSASIRSTWIKLIRATARSLKIYMDGFIPLLISKKFNDVKTRAEIKSKDFSILTPYDLDRAELFLVRRAQRQSFPDEYEALLSGKSFNHKDMQQLRVFLDDQGVIRIQSRVKLGSNVYPQQFAPLLSRENPYAKIFLLHVHYEYKHIHLETQVAAVRSKYWIPSVRVALKSIQDKCNYCRHMRAQSYAPLMAPLPTCRVDSTQFPFQTTGLDCAGPITINVFGRAKKIWILIFICTWTRFIQLHILDSLESTKVLEAIGVLWSTNGPVQTFLSDRGTNFQGASRFIREEWERTKDTLKQLHKILATEVATKFRTEWKFFPAHSPWMGGFYERPIKEVKRSIALTLENKKLTKSELNIALQDACHRINCRPLTHNPISADDEEVLTPHHLARGRAGWPYLPSNTLAEGNPKNDRSVFRRGRLLADEILRRFVTGYLPILTKRTKWFKDLTTPIQIGDLVLLIEPNQTRSEWKRARVIKICKGSDKRGRVADVEMPDGSIKKARSIQRLAKLEIHIRDETV